VPKANHSYINVHFTNSSPQYFDNPYGDSIVSFLPLAHAYGCAYEFLFPFSRGCIIHFLNKTPSPKIIMKAFAEVRPRLVLSVPLIIEKIYKKKIKPVLEEPKIKFMRKLPILRDIIHNKIRKGLIDSFGGNFIEIIIGGAALNSEVEQFFKLIKFPFSIGYGITAGMAGHTM